ncbi:hypothetical protein BD779DRAFT_1674147 [Infundibulicybe gibba]|nr:hypothetical protein BD779DRAFT_1674147 [Infundibulicybe gibba]
MSLLWVRKFIGTTIGGCQEALTSPTSTPSPTPGPPPLAELPSAPPALAPPLSPIESSPPFPRCFPPPFPPVPPSAPPSIIPNSVNSLPNPTYSPPNNPTNPTKNPLNPTKNHPNSTSDSSNISLDFSNISPTPTVATSGKSSWMALGVPGNTSPNTGFVASRAASDGAPGIGVCSAELQSEGCKREETRARIHVVGEFDSDVSNLLTGV